MIAKLEFMRIVSHEMTHVVLRRKTNDFNISTPDLFKDKIANRTFSECPESGIMLEYHLFGGKIDFFSTIESQVNTESFDFRFFQDMYDSILHLRRRIEKDNKIKYQDPSTFSLMGIDLVIEKKIIE